MCELDTVMCFARNACHTFFQVFGLVLDSLVFDYGPGKTY